jgi:hypothetical protein
MRRVIFHKISIIQSLSVNELHTGTKVKEDIEVYNSAYGRGLQIDLFDTNTKNDFLNVIKGLTERAIHEASYPVLHIEAHGSSDKQGIILQSNEFISWDDLKPCLINLNIATKLNLLVVFSLCNGAYFASHLNPQDRAPCWGLVGPIKSLSGAELLGNFSAFYKEIFASGLAGAAVEKLNESSSKGDINYYFTTATTFFFNVYQNYLHKQCTDKAYADRARAMRKELKKGNPIKVPSIGELKRKLKSTQMDFFENFRLKYFMIDLFPENKERFIVAYKDIMNYERKKL